MQWLHKISVVLVAKRFLLDLGSCFSIVHIGLGSCFGSEQSHIKCVHQCTLIVDFHGTHEH